MDNSLKKKAACFRKLLNYSLKNYPLLCYLHQFNIKNQFLSG